MRDGSEMETLWHDVRYSARMLIKNPSITAVALLTLALGIGANTAIFSVVDTVLLRPLPYEKPENLVRLWETKDASGTTVEMTSVPNLLDWRSRSHGFEGIAAWSRPAAIRLTSQMPVTELTGSFVTVNLFTLLGVPVAQGRTFLETDQTPGQNRVVILSYGLWQTAFGARPDIVGTSITLEDYSYQIVGVMPQDFQSPTGAVDFWLPRTLEVVNTDRGQHYLQAIARLASGVTLEQAQADIDGVAKSLAAQYPDTNRAWNVRLVPAHEQIVGAIRPTLLLVLGALALALLSACSNIANLLLVRAAGREREIAIRTVLGASRYRLVRQVLIESVMLSAIGAALGILVAYWGLPVLKALAPVAIPRLSDAHINVAAILFTVGLSLVAGLLFGLAPALYAGKPRLGAALKESGNRNVTIGMQRTRLRQAFVIAQVSFACLLLVGAGLLVKSFWKLHEQSTGFDTDNLLVVELSLSQSYDDNFRRITYYRQLIEQLRAKPEVVSAGAVTVLPLNRFGIDFDVPYHPAGEPDPQQSVAPKARFRSATADYFRTMEIQLTKGRMFTEGDRPNAPYVVAVNETLAQQVWPNQDPVGKRLRFFWADWQTYEVVGVVGDTRSYGLAETVRPELFVPYEQNPYTIMNVVVRSNGAPESVAAMVRQTMLAQDPKEPPHRITTMTELFGESVAREKFSMILLALLAGLALVLVAIGIYSGISYSVRERTHEIGIRMALGAKRSDILKMLVGQGMIVTSIGLIIGLVASLGVTRSLSSLFYGVSASDPFTFAGISLLLIIVALVACLIPARHATKVDPLVALHCE